MFLIILAKSLPRLASIAAFLCLVVAHLEWPDIASSFSSPMGNEQGRSYRCRTIGWHTVTVRQGRSAPGGLDHPDEVLVDAVVAGQLRVEGGGQQVALADRDDPGVRAVRGRDLGEHLDARADRLDPGGADEHPGDRVAGQPGERD